MGVCTNKNGYALVVFPLVVDGHPRGY